MHLQMHKKVHQPFFATQATLSESLAEKKEFSTNSRANYFSILNFSHRVSLNMHKFCIQPATHHHHLPAQTRFQNTTFVAPNPGQHQKKHFSAFAFHALHIVTDGFECLWMVTDYFQAEPRHLEIMSRIFSTWREFSPNHREKLLKHPLWPGFSPNTRDMQKKEQNIN